MIKHTKLERDGNFARHRTYTCTAKFTTDTEENIWSPAGKAAYDLGIWNVACERANNKTPASERSTYTAIV